MNKLERKLNFRMSWEKLEGRRVVWDGQEVVDGFLVYMFIKDVPKDPVQVCGKTTGVLGDRVSGYTSSGIVYDRVEYIRAEDEDEQKAIEDFLLKETDPVYKINGTRKTGKPRGRTPGAQGWLDQRSLREEKARRPRQLHNCPMCSCGRENKEL